MHCNVMRTRPCEAGDYLFVFSQHFIDYPMDIRKRGSELANHLFQPLSSLRLPREGIEFGKIIEHKVISPLQSSLWETWGHCRNLES